MSCEYACSYYGVPACIGRRVTVNGKPGIIAEDRGHYIGVNFDDDKPSVIKNAHPTWEVVYLGMGVIHKPSRSAARYQAYLRADRCESFGEWLNLGDSYSKESATTGGYSDKSTLGGFSGEHTKGRAMNRAESRRKIVTGLKPKDLVGIPWRVAFALRADGWYLRQDIIWHKPNPMPESVTDRCTKSHEYIFLLSKSARYYYDAVAIAEKSEWDGNSGNKNYRAGKGMTDSGMNSGGSKDTRNKRDVWTVATQPYKGAHFVTFPSSLILPCILAGCPAGGTVLDPFGGSGTTGAVASANGRSAILIELNSKYTELVNDRCGLFLSKD